MIDRKTMKQAIHEVGSHAAWKAVEIRCGEFRARIAELERCLEDTIEAGESMRAARPDSVRQWIAQANHAASVAGGKVSKGALEE